MGPIVQYADKPCLLRLQTDIVRHYQCFEKMEQKKKITFNQFLKRKQNKEANNRRKIKIKYIYNDCRDKMKQNKVEEKRRKKRKIITRV